MMPRDAAKDADLLERDAAGDADLPEATARELDPEAARDVEYMLDHLNEENADTVLMLAAYAGGRREAVAAELMRADRSAFYLRIRLADGSKVESSLPFSGPANSRAAVRAQLLELLSAARSLAADTTPLTSLEREIANNTRLSTFVTEVARVEDLTPRLRQITLHGGLAGLEPLGADDFVYVMVPRLGASPSVIVPGFRMDQMQRMPEPDRPMAAYYTIRRCTPQQESLDLWIVLHGHGDGVSDWARRAVPGDRVALWGPRRSFRPPPNTRSLLLVGDETGLPAIASILDDLGAATVAQVVIEAGDAADVVELSSSANVSVTWLFRGGSEPGTGNRLLEAVRHLDLDPTACYAFGAAEARQMAEVRRHLRQERGVPSERVRMVAYWRRRPRRAR